MKPYIWYVSFETGFDVSVTAFGEDEAKVLAQAVRIKNAQEWRNIRGARMVRPGETRHKYSNPLA